MQQCRNIKRNKRNEMEQFLKSMKLLQVLKEEEVHMICDSLTQQSFKSGITIIKEGDDSADLYFVYAGKASAYKGSNEVKKYKKGDYFGELALLRNSKRAASVIATVYNKIERL